MRYLVGAIVIVVGIGQILLRDRIARANAASNQAMWNGHGGGPKMRAYNRFMAWVVGLVFVVFGILMIAGVWQFKHWR
ncbi:hypothetical protein [Branchiibius cervicis]|uniref:Protein-export membrane protein SecG n=1 Tax=Branchiibius cervicis TaxID=908252 RepID=A0ABW2ANV8_9MICO